MKVVKIKNNLIKYKITLWYTGLLAILVASNLIGVLYFAEKYIVEEAKIELNDEVSEFCRELRKFQNISSELVRIRYYDDGVVLSIYDEQETLLDGFFSDEFPSEMEFEAGNIRELKQGSNYWVILDQKLETEKETYWIRGIYTLDLLYGMRRRVLQLWVMLVPFLLVLIAYMGYRMLKHVLNPIYNMTKMADDITRSNNLSLRLPEPTTKDELAYLLQTFNYMLQHLEEMFCQETQFTSDAAHELRTPISVISSHCEYCLEELELGEEIRKEFMIINQKANAMAELINQLLMIARAESGTYQPNFEEADLEILVESVVDELREKADIRRIQLCIENGMTQSILFVDIHLLIQILLNLIENAINYGREGGRVEIILKNEEQGILIQVRDDGIGIAPEEIDKIWNRFYRVDASHSQVKGFGLGLFMVRWMVEMHHGSVEVQSMPGVGSIFSVYLPSER